MSRFNEPSSCSFSLFPIIAFRCVSSGLSISIASHAVCSFTRCRKNTAIQHPVVAHICFYVPMVPSHNLLAFCLYVPNHYYEN